MSEFKNKQFDTKVCPSKYINRFVGLNSLEEFAKLKLFPNVKEVTESFSMYYTVKEQICQYLDTDKSMFDVCIIVVGDGVSPRTASLFAFLSKAEVHSIDPLMRVEEYKGKINRLSLYKDKIEEVNIYTDKTKVIILMPHAHAITEDSWDCVGDVEDKWLVKMPCCTKDELSWNKFLEFEDKYNMSPKNKIQIWNNNPWKTRISQPLITKLNTNEVFVFGSNCSGKHHGGAARLAMDKFGAVYSYGLGLMGDSFAIPTLSTLGNVLTIDMIQGYVNHFIDFAICNPKLTFLVTEIGCGIAGFKVEEIAPLFKSAQVVSNIHLPLKFWKELRNE